MAPGGGTIADRLATCLKRIGDKAGQGASACLTVYERSATAEAEAADIRRRAGLSLGPLDGAIVSIKDLFDVRGEVTRAGSAVLLDEGKQAVEDALAIRRLRRAGAVIIAKTNMSEFAFSGVGTNPHFGTPGNPLDRSRIPGGSSSGAAVSVADGFCDIAIGSDTGGSVRIPAALCGLTGFKPTQARVPTAGTFPLSASLDCVGSIGRSVAACIAADSVLSGDERPISPAAVKDLRLGIVAGMPFEAIDPGIDAAFQASARLLSDHVLRISSTDVPEIEEMRQLNARTGGIVAAEAYALHAARMSNSGRMDPHIAMRIEKGGTAPAASYIELLAARRRLMQNLEALWERIDILAMPTVPVPAPTIAEVATPTRFNECNMLLLRNPAIANFFDWPAISLPVRHEGTVTGLMLVARPGGDRRLLAAASAIEAALREGGIGFQHGERQ